MFLLLQSAKLVIKVEVGYFCVKSRSLFQTRKHMNQLCQKCNKIFLWNKTSKQSSDYCSACRSKEKRTVLKKRCVQYMGGKCESCGYNKSVFALQFHHKNVLEKDFEISSASGYSWLNIREELKKCILLCANCHAEEHEG